VTESCGVFVRFFAPLHRSINVVAKTEAVLKSNLSPKYYGCLKMILPFIQFVKLFWNGVGKRFRKIFNQRGRKNSDSSSFRYKLQKHQAQTEEIANPWFTYFKFNPDDYWSKLKFQF
jgi:hypothetical protein